ncbi:MAG TPA: DNA translocase FtsK [Aestuariivirgaceae bacterium]|nr:DNA translocase FtsK [Aestuariivirgaceae bacterium]
MRARSAPHPQALDTDDRAIPGALRLFVRNRLLELAGFVVLGSTLFLGLSLASWSVDDPSLNNAVDAIPLNWFGLPGAIVADELMQRLGLGAVVLVIVPIAWAVQLFAHRTPDRVVRRLTAWCGAVLLAAGLVSLFPPPSSWILGSNLGGTVGDAMAAAVLTLLSVALKGGFASVAAVLMLGFATAMALLSACGANGDDVVSFARIFGERVQDVVARTLGRIAHAGLHLKATFLRLRAGLRRGGAEPPGSERMRSHPAVRSSWRQGLSRLAAWGRASPRVEPLLIPGEAGQSPHQSIFAKPEQNGEGTSDEAGASPSHGRVAAGKPVKPGKRLSRDLQPDFAFDGDSPFALPPLTLLSEPRSPARPADLSADALEQNARMLEGVLEDFGVRGEIIHVRPGPVVTLYELEPAPGIKSSRVIGLADDIARSMSAVSARVAVVPGRNVIGIELPNSRRETVYLRELLSSQAYERSGQALPLALGKNIGGEPILADLARMPHLLIAGTTGSGKSVAINTMILSLLYRLTPEQCRVIMIDPKMLELSVYDGIPHLLAPVVTDPRKAIVALKWAVREMEDRYRKMSKLGVRNIDGFNARARQAVERGEALVRTVQTGYDAHTGEPVFEQEAMDLAPFPFVVVIIDEMADLMMVAGKEIEGAVQRLAQMARAAGIHVIMATQRPSVDVITGTIKANFPTRVSFQVTSKIDSRTILGEQGAEQLLGQGDMLYMAGGGRITRLHGAFVSDEEVEQIVSFLKSQGTPEYLEAVTEESEAGDEPGEQIDGFGGFESSSGDELYDQAVAVVLRDKKVSTSYIQRRLQIGYNKAASLIERMETEGVISSPNHGGKREILVDNGVDHDA